MQPWVASGWRHLDAVDSPSQIEVDHSEMTAAQVQYYSKEQSRLGIVQFA